jgi:GNAT superfamily N-acetyltransferase
MTIDHAIEVFVHGYSFVRSFSHLYVPERIHPGIWMLRDAERKRGDYRTEEYVAHGLEPTEVLNTALASTRGPFKISVIRAASESDAGIRTGFKTLGCRLMTTEGFFVHHLNDLIRPECAADIVRVTTQAQADLLTTATLRRHILPKHLTAEPPPLRQYMALIDGRPVGWVGSVPVCGATWCTSMYVHPLHRRRGIARALMLRMLMDDRDSGASASVLLASHAGAKLYPVLGYERIGELLMFTPPKRQTAA